MKGVLAALEKAGKVNKIAHDMNKNRSDAFQARMQSGKQARTLKIIGNNPSVALETNTLNGLRDAAYGMNSADMITVCVDARMGKNISMQLGSISRAYSADTSMDSTLLIFSHEPD